MLATLEADYIGRVLLTFLVSMVPVVELRGGIPFGTALGLDPVSTYSTGCAGTISRARSSKNLKRRRI